MPAMAGLGALWRQYPLVAAFLEATGSSRSTGAMGKVCAGHKVRKGMRDRCG